MADDRLGSHETIALIGAEQLNDEELISSLVELAGEVATALEVDLEDLRELAVVCLVAARRIEERTR